MATYTVKYPKCKKQFDIEKGMNDWFSNCEKCHIEVERVFVLISDIWKCNGNFERK